VQCETVWKSKPKIVYISICDLKTVYSLIHDSQNVKKISSHEMPVRWETLKFNLYYWVMSKNLNICINEII